MLATMLADHLRAGFPHEVRVFHTGEDCLAQLGERPSLVIPDHHLDTVVKDAADGSLVLERIKERDPQVHVIMLSSRARFGIAMRTMRKGAEQCVVQGREQFDQIDRLVQELLG